ncbi:MAG: quinol dehydrogenase ferredoxin subunit NapH [Arcobacter sp.]|nr:quinol dehydrogenase ferredoxin subunit NapH [Arcobacter sp.]
MIDFFKNYKYLFLRRFTQISILFLYFCANAYGFNLLKGNLSSSEFLYFIPLSDPFAVLQMFFAGVLIASDILIGSLIIILFYSIIAGRAFCSWVCPINMISDLASWLRRKLLKRTPSDLTIGKSFRYWFLALTFILSFIFSITAFELISPISIFTRGIVFGFGFAWLFLLMIFLFDLFVQDNVWCGNICPLGAFYSLLGRRNIIKIKYNLDTCTQCNNCLNICPEEQVLNMIGKKSDIIIQAECTKCGRCIEVCGTDSLEFSIIDIAKQNQK